MGFLDVLGKIGQGVGSIGNIFNGIGGIIGGIFGGGDDDNPYEQLLGLSGTEWQQYLRRTNEANKQQYEQQTQYAKQMADYNQKLGMEMWNATNYEAQVAHMKAAGLSPGLMYGGASGSGAVSQGGTAAGMPSAGTNALDIAIQLKQLQLQEKAIKAQSTLQYAQAAQASAGARKESTEAESNLAGIAKTVEETNKIIEEQGLIKAQTNTEFATKNYYDALAEKTGEETENTRVQRSIMEKQEKRLTQDIFAADIDNKVKAQTWTWQVLNSKMAAIRGYWDAMNAKENLNLTQAQIDSLQEMTKARVADLTSQVEYRSGMLEIEGQKVDVEILHENNEYDKWQQNLELSEKQLKVVKTKMWVDGVNDLLGTVKDGIVEIAKMRSGKGLAEQVQEEITTWSKTITDKNGQPTGSETTTEHKSKYPRSDAYEKGKQAGREEGRREAKEHFDKLGRKK